MQVIKYLAVLSGLLLTLQQSIAEQLSDSISISYLYYNRIDRINEEEVTLIRNPLESELSVNLYKITINKDLLPSDKEQLDALFKQCNFISGDVKHCGQMEDVFTYDFPSPHTISDRDISADFSVFYLSNKVFSDLAPSYTAEIELHHEFEYQSDKELIIFKLEIIPTTLQEDATLHETTMPSIRNINVKLHQQSNSQFGYFHSSYLYPTKSTIPQPCTQAKLITRENDQFKLCLELEPSQNLDIDLEVYDLFVKLTKDDVISNFSSSFQSFYIYSNYEIKTASESDGAGSNSAWLMLFVAFMARRKSKNY